MEVLLHIENYSLHLNTKEELTLLDKIDFKIYASEILGLVGSSGSGKSLTARSILRLHQQLPAYTEQGKIILDSKDGLVDLCSSNDSKFASEAIGLVFQQSAQVFNPIQTIGKQLAEKLGQIKSLDSNSSQDVIKKCLEDVALSPAERFLDAYPHQLSGGQLQRILIALSLLNAPKLVIADEPFSALDGQTQIEIIGLIKDLQNKYGIAFVIISHNLELVRNLCQRLVFIDKGQIIGQGSIAEVFVSPKHPLIKAYRDQDSSVLQKQKEELANEVLFQIKNISKAYKSKKIFANNDKELVSVFDDFSLDIYKGEMLGLVGQSGSGKSTLGRILLRLEGIDSGRILYQNTNLHFYDKQAMIAFRRSCQIIFQDPYSSMSPHRTLIQHFEDAADVMRQSLDLTKVRDLLDFVELDSKLLHRLPKQLSGGQRQRVLIARALYMDVSFLVCDEILSSLDSLVGYRILNLIKRIVENRALTVLFISHDIKIVTKICDRVIQL